MQKLSNYTHARYCSDETDVLDAIVEIQEAIKNRSNRGTKIPYYFYVRLNKLNTKLKKIREEKIMKNDRDEGQQ